MSIKESVLEQFEAHREEYLSGEQIAAALGVSRSAVWKAVRSLQTEGYLFDGVSGKGYRLREGGDVLSAQAIRRYLGDAAEGLNLLVRRTVTSTNTLLKEMAAEGAPAFTVLAAEEQTAGRGRMNRSFYSPAATGLYLSILLRPSMKAEDALFITTAAAVAVARAIEKVSGKTAGIKWVNDVFVDGKKVCGILTEGSLSMESGRLECAICGIGVNLCDPPEGFPEDIRHAAGSLFGHEAPPAEVRSRLAAEILREFLAFYAAWETQPFLDEYIRRSVVVGRDVTVLGRGEPRTATVLAIDRRCRLCVRYADGTEEALSSGEISVRLI